MEYKIYIDKKERSYESLNSSLSFIGRFELNHKGMCILHFNDSVMYIDTALEYIKRIVPEDYIVNVKEHAFQYRTPKEYTKKSNTKKKQGYTRKRK